MDGATFGFVAYATYDLTNQATLKNWSTLLTLADLGWGAFLSALAARGRASRRRDSRREIAQVPTLSSSSRAAVRRAAFSRVFFFAFSSENECQTAMTRTTPKENVISIAP